MSFQYHGVMVSLNNYVSVFDGLFTSEARSKNSSMDFIDEIRLAILDDTPIGDFIDKCLKLPSGCAKLREIRKSLREFVPIRFINVNESSEVIEAIRSLYVRKGESALGVIESYVQDYINGVISSGVLLKIITAVSEDADISMVDFKNVPANNVSAVVVGLIKGYPMWLVADVNMSHEKMQIFMQAMMLGVDVHPYLEGDWNNQCMQLVISLSSKDYYDELIQNINCNFEHGQLEEIVEAASDNTDFGLLCMKDEEGYPCFNQYQMFVLRKAIKQGVLTKEMYDFRKSDMEMQDLLDKELEKQS